MSDEYATTDKANAPISHRVATRDDAPAIIALMGAAIERNMREFLSPAEIKAARETMGIDSTLIDDGTYFVIEAQLDGGLHMVGCGGWGKRGTLYGGDASPGRDERLLDPAHEAARIRAMYTHPDWTRRGIGSLLLRLGEDAARAAGFKHIELGSTIPGLPLYEACGFTEIDRHEHTGANGERNVIVVMRKPL